MLSKNIYTNLQNLYKYEVDTKRTLQFYWWTVMWVLRGPTSERFIAHSFTYLYKLNQKSKPPCRLCTVKYSINLLSLANYTLPRSISTARLPDCHRRTDTGYSWFRRTLRNRILRRRPRAKRCRIFCPSILWSPWRHAGLVGIRTLVGDSEVQNFNNQKWWTNSGNFERF